jgi:hypothetical protein
VAAVNTNVVIALAATVREALFVLCGPDVLVHSHQLVLDSLNF